MAAMEAFPDRNRLTGVVLAGGRARRMGGQDKGLIPFRGRPLVAYALEALDAVAGRILINANRNREQYARFGYPVVGDAGDGFEGPLAGLLAALRAAETPYVLTVPCDSPLVAGPLLARLWTRLEAAGAEIAVAHDGAWLQPVFLLAERGLAEDLAAYLAGGGRKIDTWLHTRRLAITDFSDHPELFTNLNTPEELAELERQLGSSPAPAVSLQQRPDLRMTDAGRASCYAATAIDEYGERRELELVGERALTLFVDKYEIVTLMTIGTHPELLTLGYLKNQGFIERIEDIAAVQVDWDTEAVAVITRLPQHDFLDRLGSRTVTTGCGQGTVFGRLMEQLREIRVPPVPLRQSEIYAVFEALRDYNEVYKRAGAVHGCALCQNGRIEIFVEDVGRHNAVDAIAGYMWLNGIEGADKLFYTTGRLTSEMVIKVTQMGIPVLLSRSGATQMGLELARQAGVTLIARAKGRHFQVLSGAERIEFDAIPPKRPGDGKYRETGDD